MKFFEILPYFRSNPALMLPWPAAMLGIFNNRSVPMLTNMTIETELRHAVIDRLIAASLRDGTPAREANLQRWRNMSAKAPEAPLNEAAA